MFPFTQMGTDLTKAFSALVGFVIAPHVSKTQSQAFSCEFIAIEKIPGRRVEPSPVEAKYYEASSLPSELAGPGSLSIY